MGLNDTLIQPESVIYQYVSYKNFRPELAFLKAFPRMGHIDFTIGASNPLIDFIIDTLQKTCEDEELADDGEEIESEPESAPSSPIASEPSPLMSPEGSPPVEFSLLGR